MDSKVFELRAPATIMVIMATRLEVFNEAERYLLSRSGFGRNNNDFKKYIMLQCLDGGTSTASTDPYKHGIRELRIVHCYIYEMFDQLDDGQVLDIDFILGNTFEPKQPERIQTQRDLIEMGSEE